VVLRCPSICSRSTASETCGLTLKTERESAENGTEVPHPSVQTTDGKMGHPRYSTAQEIRAFATRQRACHPSPPLRMPQWLSHPPNAGSGGPCIPPTTTS